MKRRDFLKKAGLGAAAVAATTINAPAVLAQKSYRWKMVTTWPPKLPVLQEGCERLAKRLDEMTGGQLKIQVFAAGDRNWAGHLRAVLVVDPLIDQPHAAAAGQVEEAG